MAPLRWLQYSTQDLKAGLGGVETHARALNTALRELGVDAEISQDPAALQEKWDVLELHGSLSGTFKAAGNPLRVLTLHGSSLARMAACHEWTWIGGYRAWLCEVARSRQANVVFGVHPGVQQLVGFGSIKVIPCFNGWDSFKWDSLTSEDAAPDPSCQGKWLFIGRGADFVKGADYLKLYLEEADRAGASPEQAAQFCAIPGEGFENLPQVKQAGRKTTAQIRATLQTAAGLVLPSRFEGLPLVVLEALGQGTPVVCHRVGGIPSLEKLGLAGLRLISPGDISDFWRAVSELGGLTQDARAEAAQINQGLLPSWRKVAEIKLAAIKAALASMRPTA